MKRTLAIGALAATLSIVSLSACSSEEPAASAPAPAAGPDRSKAALEKALLGVKDLPEGYAVQPEAEEGGATPVARSEDPKCAAFVRLINAENLPGSKASALVAFAGGNEGPFVEEWLEAMGDEAAVTTVQEQLGSSVEECGEVTVSLPGSGAAQMELNAFEPPAVGEAPLGYRMTAVDGSFEGLEITFVHTRVGDTLLTMNFVAVEPSELEQLVTAAEKKASSALGSAAG